MEKQVILEQLKKAALDAYVPASEQFVNAVIDQVLEPALKEMVLKSENKIDDGLLPVIYPKLEEAVKAEIAKLFAKLK